MIIEMIMLILKAHMGRVQAVLGDISISQNPNPKQWIAEIVQLYGEIIEKAYKASQLKDMNSHWDSLSAIIMEAIDIDIIRYQGNPYLSKFLQHDTNQKRKFDMLSEDFIKKNQDMTLRINNTDLIQELQVLTALVGCVQADKMQDEQAQWTRKLVQDTANSRLKGF